MSRGQGAADAAHEHLGLVIRGAEGGGDDLESVVGDAARELVQESLLPGGRVVHDGDGIRAELQRGRRAPQWRMGGIQSEHSPIMPIRARSRRVSTGAAKAARARPRLGRSR